MCKRAKLRGSPKDLVTKEKYENFFLAWLIIQGTVISQDMIEIEMGDRGSKSAEIFAVKEQRVDGSSV